jgi:hypothetical protein
VTLLVFIVLMCCIGFFVQRYVMYDVVIIMLLVEVAVVLCIECVYFLCMCF